MYRPTQRSYEHVHTGEIFTMYKNSNTGNLTLIGNKTGTEISEFICAAFTDIVLKYADKSELKLNVGQFVGTLSYKPTHKKFFCEKRFKTI
jgi:hypothetical protein